MFKMTKIKTSLLVGGVLLFGFSCKNKDDGGQGSSSPSKGSVKFSIEEINSALRLSNVSKDDVKSVQVTIKDADGNEQTQNLDFLSFSDDYISEPIELATGDYTLEGFHALDADDEVIYSTPIEGSEKAYLVQKPLPLDVVVTTNYTNLVTTEVVSIEENTDPTDLGYLTFDFEIVNTFDFWVAGFVYDTDLSDLELTEFEYSVTPAGATTLTGSADAITNMILVRGEEDTYEVSFKKEGYYIRSDVKTTYTQAELAAYTSDHPLKLIFDDDVTEGLVAYYPFNGDANDESLNDNNGTVNGASLTTGRKGNSNSAYDFNGTSNYIEVPHDNSLSQIGTISAWVNPTANTDEFIVEKISTNATYPYDYRLWIGNDKDFMFRVVDEGGERLSVTSGSEVKLNDWTFVTAVYNFEENYLQIYVNGESAVKQSIDNIDLRESDGLLYIGKTDAGEKSHNYFKGVIDDIRIYDRALTEKEISFLYVK